MICNPPHSKITMSAPTETEISIAALDLETMMPRPPRTQMTAGTAASSPPLRPITELRTSRQAPMRSNGTATTALTTRTPVDDLAPVAGGWDRGVAVGAQLDPGPKMAPQALHEALHSGPVSSAAQFGH